MTLSVKFVSLLMQAIPVRPIVLDVAQQYVTPPDLGHRLESAPVARSLGARLFGWK